MTSLNLNLCYVTFLLLVPSFIWKIRYQDYSRETCLEAVRFFYSTNLEEVSIILKTLVSTDLNRCPLSVIFLVDQRHESRRGTSWDCQLDVVRLASSYDQEDLEICVILGTFFLDAYRSLLLLTPALLKSNSSIPYY